MTTITLPPLKIERLSLTLVGDSPLIVHAWSEKAKRQMARDRRCDTGEPPGDR